MMHALLVVAALCSAVEPPKASAHTATAAEVKKSTAAPAITTIYTVERLRDPFVAGGMGTGGGGGSASSKPFETTDFNIHNLQLKGIMKDTDADFALLYDTEFGVSFVLRKGKIYDSKKKPMPNVKGMIIAKERTVKLEGQEGDVQVLRLGEEEEAQ